MISSACSALSKVPYVHPAGSTSSQDDDKDSCGHDREATLQASGAPTSSVPVPTLTVNGSSSGFSTDNHTTRRRPTTGASRGTHHGAHPTPRLRPARNPPPPARLRDLFPFSLVAKRGSRADDLEMAAYQRQKVADAKKGESSSNVPFELTLYMGSFIATLTKRNTADVPTRSASRRSPPDGELQSDLSVRPLCSLAPERAPQSDGLPHRVRRLALLSSAPRWLTIFASLRTLLRRLERILTTPIPFSYAAVSHAPSPGGSLLWMPSR